MPFPMRFHVHLSKNQHLTTACSSALWKIHVHCTFITIISQVSSQPSHFPDTRLDDLRRAAQQDEVYQQLVVAVPHDLPCSNDMLPRYLLPFWNVRRKLSSHDDLILTGCQILITKASRKTTLDALHDAHQGIKRSKRRARQTVW